MTTIVNSPPAVADSGGNSFFIAVIVLISFVAIALYFGIPAVQRMEPIQVNIPATQVVMPEKVDVQVTQPK